jgi:sortase (surface protein transpeptidase)
VNQRPIPPIPRPRRRSARALALAGIGLVAVGASMYGAAAGPRQLDTRAQEQRLLPDPVERPAPVAFAAARREAFAGREDKPPHRRWLAKQEPRPVKIVIPAIGVSAPIIRLARNRDGTMQVPASFSQAGWFRPGPEPGEIGPAVIVGHVDSRSGPGVFFRLRALERGDRIRVELADGRTLRFAVTSTRDASKHRFPSKLLFARTPRPTLRLVTCGGRFDSSTGHYVDNHVVFAWLISRQ